MKNTITLLAGLILSFTSFSQETLKIEWPKEYKLEVASEQVTEQSTMVELIPKKEDRNNWSMMVRSASLKDVPEASFDNLKDVMFTTAQRKAPKAQLSEIERDASWVIFKIDSGETNDGSQPESQLWFIRQGGPTLYMNSISMRATSLKADFVKKWTEVFKESKIVQVKEGN